MGAGHALEEAQVGSVLRVGGQVAGQEHSTISGSQQPLCWGPAGPGFRLGQSRQRSSDNSARQPLPEPGPSS